MGSPTRAQHKHQPGRFLDTALPLRKQLSYGHKDRQVHYSVLWSSSLCESTQKSGADILGSRDMMGQFILTLDVRFFSIRRHLPREVLFFCARRQILCVNPSKFEPSVSDMITNDSSVSHVTCDSIDRIFPPPSSPPPGETQSQHGGPAPPTPNDLVDPPAPLYSFFREPAQAPQQL